MTAFPHAVQDDPQQGDAQDVQGRPPSGDPLARALSLFDRYSELAPHALKQALAQLQQEDPEGCRELMGLLAADEQTHSFASPLRWFAARGQATESKREVHADGTMFGPWRAEGILGIGGMGVIYAVHRADGLYEREAALKTIRAELSSPQLLEAFRLERNLLARLDHPAIVGLFDAGVSENGQPWLAMQRVVGDHIDRWCDARKATIRRRVELIVDVCDALLYAHARGILHQDIKPSNVLVTDDGKVKLLDFGLAAIVSQQSEAAAERIGISAAYAAPEMYGDTPPSVAIDVHALGVMLFRLLCDSWPRPSGLVIGDAHPATIPTAPCALALRAGDEAAQRRGCRSARALSDLLGGDLDAIALRCVANDPDKRYASAAELRADLKAWLEWRPVIARQGGAAYRAGRFAYRHLLAVTVAAAMVVAGYGLVRQWYRSTIEADNDRVLTQLFQTSLVEATRNAQSAATNDIRPFLRSTEQRLRATAGDSRREFLARGLAVLGEAYYAQSDYAQSERLWLQVRDLETEDPMLRARTATSLASLANKRMDMLAVEDYAREGIAALEGRDDEESVRVWMGLQNSLARSYWLRDETDRALPILDLAIRVARAHGPACEAQLASLLRQRGVMLSTVHRHVEAERDLSEAMSRLGKSSPDARASVEQSLAILRMRMGHGESGRILAAHALIDTLHYSGPEHIETARAWLTMAKLWRGTGSDLRRAGIALTRAEEIITHRLGDVHPQLQDILEERAELESSLGHRAIAVTYAQRAERLAEKTFGVGSRRARECTALREKVEAGGVRPAP